MAPLPSTDESIYQASAPGKVILCGEYSVLAGSSALACAVDRRVKLELGSVDDAYRSDCPTLTVSAQGHSAAPCQFVYRDAIPSWQFMGDGPFDGWQFLQRALNALSTPKPLEAVLKHNPHWHLSIDSSELFRGTKKLGLGSSGALVTALDALLSCLCTGGNAQQNVEQRWPLLQKAHCIAQGKRGSGTDIAASVSGGSVLFQPSRDRQRCRIRPYRLSAGLHMVFLWSGHSAATTHHLNSLQHWKVKNNVLYNELMNALTCQVDGIVSATDSDTVMARLCQFTEVLKRLDEASGIGIFAAGHDGLYAKSMVYSGLLYKPCGAGGGDLGVAISRDLQQLSQFVAEAATYNFEPIDLNVDALGAEASIRCRAS